MICIKRNLAYRETAAHWRGPSRSLGWIRSWSSPIRRISSLRSPKMGTRSRTSIAAARRARWPCSRRHQRLRQHRAAQPVGRGCPGRRSQAGEIVAGRRCGAWSGSWQIAAREHRTRGPLDRSREPLDERSRSPFRFDRKQNTSSSLTRTGNLANREPWHPGRRPCCSHGIQAGHRQSRAARTWAKLAAGRGHPGDGCTPVTGRARPAARSQLRAHKPS
jgi:hypothetical protein